MSHEDFCTPESRSSTEVPEPGTSARALGAIVLSGLEAEVPPPAKPDRSASAPNSQLGDADRSEGDVVQREGGSGSRDEQIRAQIAAAGLTGRAADVAKAALDANYRDLTQQFTNNRAAARKLPITAVPAGARQ